MIDTYDLTEKGDCEQSVREYDLAFHHFVSGRFERAAWDVPALLE